MKDRWIRLWANGVFLALVLWMLAPEVSALDVPVFVENPSAKGFPEVARMKAPVTGGIPLPPGEVKDVRELVLRDASGAPVPVQISVLSTHADGSPHWVRLDFLVDIPAGKTLRFQLGKGQDHPSVDRPVVTREQEASLVLNNGILEIAMRTKGFNGVHSVELFGRQVLRSSGAPGVILADGTEYRAGDPTSVAYDVRGPIRTTLCMKGPYVEAGTNRLLEGFGYTIRLTLWAGSGVVKLEHLLKNARDDQGQNLHIRHAWMDLEAPSSGAFDVREKSLAFQSSDGNGFLQARHQGAFKNIGPCFRAEDGVLRIGLVPRKDKHVDQSKSGTYYTNLEQGGTAYWLSDMSYKGTRVFMALGERPFEPVEAWDFAAEEPLHARCPSSWYATHDGLGIGPFGDLDDEKEVYRTWGWKRWDDEKRQPRDHEARPEFHKQFLNVHKVSEADQLRGLIVQYARTGQRGYLDRASAWAEYLTYHYVPRTEGFAVHDTIMEWKGWHWGKGRPMQGKVPGMVRWLCRGRADGCHDYGVGLGNWYLLTGDPEALSALVDLCEKYRERYGKATPGKDETNPWGMRGIGRHLGALARLYAITRADEWGNLMNRVARLILEDPQRDERGFIRKTRWLARFDGILETKKCPESIRRLVSDQGIAVDANGHPFSEAYGTWRLTSIGGWQQAIAAMGMYDYYRQTGEEDARDYLIAFAEALMKYCVSASCGHAHAYTTIGFPTPDGACNPPRYWDWNQHCRPGRPGKHDGWYTKRLVNAVVAGYLLSGRPHLLEGAKGLWAKGSKVAWWTLPRAAEDEVYRFADIERSTKNDEVSSASLLFRAYADAREDTRPPAPIVDLKASPVGPGVVQLSWTAPSDDSGQATRYQVKAASLPIVSYERFDFAHERGKMRNWNYAWNVAGEPAPAGPGSAESMTVKALGPGRYWFAVRSYDEVSNQSGLSNLAEVRVR